MRQNSYFAIVAIAFIALSAVSSRSGIHTAEPAEQTIAQIEAEQAAALLNVDLTALDRIWTDDFVFTAPNGMVISKRGYLSMLKSGDLKYEAFKLEEIKVRVHGDAAVATGRAAVKGKVWDHVIDGQDRYTTTYVREHDTWRAVATHASRITQTAGVPALREDKN